MAVALAVGPFLLLVMVASKPLLLALVSRVVLIMNIASLCVTIAILFMRVCVC